MTWRNQLQLEHSFSNDELIRFRDVYSASLLARRAIYSSDFETPATLEESIQVTPAGSEVLEIMEAKVEDYRRADGLLAVLSIFGHEDPFVEISSYDLGTMRDILHHGTMEGDITYPWVYRRKLYDKFFEEYPTRTDTLSPDDTRKLLDGTPSGVFHCKNFLVGPLGTFLTDHERVLYPEKNLPLWHCSDPSCSRLHSVKLTSPAANVVRFRQLLKNVSSANGPPSEWSSLFHSLGRKVFDYYDDQNLASLPWLLGNAFDRAEHRILISSALSEYGDSIREFVSDEHPNSAKFHQPPEETAKDLGPAESHQVLLMLRDDQLVILLETCIEEGKIEIPPTEIRVPHYFKGSSWYDVSTQCSSLGLRTHTSTMPNLGAARLKRLISQTYRDLGDLSRLEWQLRHSQGTTIDQRLTSYIYENDPEAILDELILDAPHILEKAFDVLRFGLFEMPATEDAEKRLKQRMLWKLGFEIARYPKYMALFWKRLEQFWENAAQGEVVTEQGREKIRSAGANFFVSLEEILDYSLSYSTWALLSDHYTDTRFTFSLPEARATMAEKLNEYQTEGLEVSYESDGRNTLFPLVHGFSILSELCKKLEEQEDPSLKKTETELPGYHGRSTLEPFPFAHKALYLDLQDNDARTTLEVLKETTRRLDGSNIIQVRNGIDHKQQVFPTPDEILDALTGVRESIQKLEELGLMPLVYYYSGAEIDSFGRRFVYYVDYQGREFIERAIYPRRRPYPPSKVPQIVAPGLRLRRSNEPIRFIYVENSPYQTIWADFPKRRTRV